MDIIISNMQQDFCVILYLLHVVQVKLDEGVVLLSE